MWVRDPLPFFERFPEADILTSSDEVAPTVGAAEELERSYGVDGPLNVGAWECRCVGCALRARAWPQHVRTGWAGHGIG